MTPKEKAQDLFDKFHKQCNCTIAGASTMFRQIAKGYALIAVEEVAQELTAHCIKCLYWDKVKEEINQIN